MWLSASRHRSASEAAEAPRCVSAIAYKPVAASALQLWAPSLRQLPRCAAAHTTWPKEKKTRRPGSAAGRTQEVWPQTKKETRRQPLIRAPAHLLVRWVLGHEDCDGSTSGYGEGRCAQGKKRNGGGTARADTIGQYFYLFFQHNACQRPRRRCLPHHERFRPPDLLACWERAPI